MGLWFVSDPESIVGNMEVRVPRGMASTHMYIYAMQKYFMILLNISRCMHGIFFEFLRLHGKYYCGFLHTIKIIHMGLKDFIM
jgi:hypothetical protein